MAYGLTKSLDLESTSSQYASATDSASLSVTSNFTAEAWIKLESSATERFIVGKIDNTARRNWRFSTSDFAGNGRLRGEIDCTANGSAGYVSTSNVDLSTGTWYHVAMTWVPSNVVKLFIDGTETTYASQSTIGAGGSSIADSNIPTTVGGEPSFLGYYFDGKLSLVRIWTTDRSAANLSANMCSVLGSTTNLSAEWTLDDVYTDNSGNSNTLTATGSPVFATDTPSVCAVSGPTNLKSLDTNVKANIKSYNTNVLANIKSINTNA